MGYDADSIEYRILAGKECLVRWCMNIREVVPERDLLKATVASYFKDASDSKNQEGRGSIGTDPTVT